MCGFHLTHYSYSLLADQKSGPEQPQLGGCRLQSLLVSVARETSTHQVYCSFSFLISHHEIRSHHEMKQWLTHICQYLRWGIIKNQGSLIRRCDFWISQPSAVSYLAPDIKKGTKKQRTTRTRKQKHRKEQEQESKNNKERKRNALPCRGTEALRPRHFLLGLSAEP